MKIIIRTSSFEVKPLQLEGRLIASYESFTVKPKPSGVVLKKNENRSVFKTDVNIGVVLRKESVTKILKQND